jgi:8-oxo-dGTP pyrophosphatase MutT (NUDIX family)
MRPKDGSRPGSPSRVDVPDPNYAFSDRWIRLRLGTVVQADGRTFPGGPILEYPDWVDVIALTDDFNVVLVEQYRHGVGERRTEFPAGTVDDPAEPPLVAVQRELLEETGHASDEWHLLGAAHVYPARQTNRIHSFLALGARRVAAQHLDEGEVIRAYELPFTDFIEQVRNGAIELPALQLADLFWLRQHLARSTDPRLLPLRF